MAHKKEQYPKELRKGVPSHILLDFKVLKFNIECMTKMINYGFNKDFNFSKEEYDLFTDKDKLKEFKDRYEKILSEYSKH